MPVPSQAFGDCLHAGAEITCGVFTACEQNDGYVRHRGIEAVPVGHCVNVGEALQEARTHRGTKVVELIFAVVGDDLLAASHPASRAVVFAQAVGKSVKHLGDEGLRGGVCRSGGHGFRKRLVVKGGLEAARLRYDPA